MPKVVEVIYENGVFKPLEKVDLPQGIKIKIEIKEELGRITEEYVKELERILDTLPKVKVDFKRLDEIYYEGKMLY
jgi:predicted DNA-binding antitoxin AbrB/MazE fold protein